MPPQPASKTTDLMEEAISILADLPEGYRVFVTSPYVPQLYQLNRDFHDSGLVGVMFMTVTQIISGGLRGYNGVLLVDNVDQLTAKESDLLYAEKQLLEGSGNYGVNATSVGGYSQPQKRKHSLGRRRKWQIRHGARVLRRKRIA